MWKCPECKKWNDPKRSICWSCNQGMRNEAEEWTPHKADSDYEE